MPSQSKQSKKRKPFDPFVKQFVNRSQLPTKSNRLVRPTYNRKEANTMKAYIILSHNANGSMQAMMQVIAEESSCLAMIDMINAYDPFQFMLAF